MARESGGGECLRRGLDFVELEALTAGGCYFTDDIILEVGKEDTKESESPIILEEAVLDEPFTLFKEHGVSAGIGNSLFLEQVVNQIVKESLTDLIPSYKEVLS